MRGPGEARATLWQQVAVLHEELSVTEALRTVLEERGLVAQRAGSECAASELDRGAFQQLAHLSRTELEELAARQVFPGQSRQVGGIQADGERDPQYEL